MISAVYLFLITRVEKDIFNVSINIYSSYQLILSKSSNLHSSNDSVKNLVRFNFFFFFFFFHLYKRNASFSQINRNSVESKKFTHVKKKKKERKIEKQATSNT